MNVVCSELISHVSAFAHCKHLQHLRLPHKLRRIEQEAFLKCASLREVSVPPTLLLYIFPDVPSPAAHSFANSIVWENAQPGGEHTPEPTRSSSVTTLICRSGFVFCHLIERMRTNGQMIPMQYQVSGRCLKRHVAEPFSWHPCAGPDYVRGHLP